MHKLLIFVAFGLILYSLFSIVTAQDDWRNFLPCSDGEEKPCGSNLGVCKAGKRICSGGSWRPCDLENYPAPEVCGNGLDEDCNGIADDCFDPFPLIFVVICVVIFAFGWFLYSRN
ncbi:MAG: hypothetical protein ABIH52_02690 [Candidatus Aenigmatarchaeota archaeon]|nr:hypothetical protein [Nanoarchaeota archaeon]